MHFLKFLGLVPLCALQLQGSVLDTAAARSLVRGMSLRIPMPTDDRPTEYRPGSRDRGPHLLEIAAATALQRLRRASGLPVKITSP